jgi:hypothetical protein
MRSLFAAALVSSAALATPTHAYAQDAGDLAAYFALTLTPVGGFVPHPAAPAGTSGNAFVMRYGHLDLGLGSLHNFAIGGDFAAGSGRLGLTLGGTTCDGCDGNVMAGVDYTAPLTQNVLSVAVRPALGFSKPLEGSGTAVSMGLSLPISAELSEATGPIFIPFIVPGFGIGRVSGNEDSESGTRPMLGGGLSIAGRQSGFAVHLGFQKVFLEGAETTFGLGVSIGHRATAP